MLLFTCSKVIGQKIVTFSKSIIPNYFDQVTFPRLSDCLQLLFETFFVNLSPGEMLKGSRFLAHIVRGIA